MSGRFIAVVGPSGVGKDSVMEAIAAREPRVVLARRVITRPSDAGGEAFDGVSAEAFAQMEARAEFALSWAAHGLSYGIPADVDAALEAGQDVVANLSRAVLDTARARFSQVYVLALQADRAVLAARLAARGRETADDIARRLARADAHRATGPNVWCVDNSGALEHTVVQVLDLLYPGRVEP
ncbi:MAG: phosphonate metabolism protein/1,5-bisphosphokinase (PRPP-forming) PhnN [Sedimentitalea sp.]